MTEHDAKELWTEIRLMQASMARIEAMLGERCEARVTRIKSLERQQEDADKRLDKLEQLRAQILVIAALGSMVGGALVAWLFRVLG